MQIDAQYFFLALGCYIAGAMYSILNFKVRGLDFLNAHLRAVRQEIGKVKNRSIQQTFLISIGNLLSPGLWLKRTRVCDCNKKHCRPLMQTAKFISVEWCVSNPEAAWEQVKLFIEGFSPTLKSQSFLTESVVELIAASNMLENTLCPGHSKPETDTLLRQLFHDEVHHINSTQSTVPLWDAEGQTGDSTRAQLLQHLRAWLFLHHHLSSELTPALICRCHAILMDGACQPDQCRKLIDAGRYRTFPVHSRGHDGGPYSFLTPADIPDSMDRTLRRYAELRSAGGDSILAAAFLYYEILTIHPFENGNGRLCRLLLAYALVVGGFPFPVVLSSGHSRARQHCMRALFAARRSTHGLLADKLAPLSTLILTAMVHIMNKFLKRDSDRHLDKVERGRTTHSAV